MNIKRAVYLLVRLFAGLFLYGLGIVVMVNAQIGLSPWDVFHQGMSMKLGITMGQASISVGLIIVILDAVLGEGVGWGTVFNMIFIGLFLDIIKASGIIPMSTSFGMGLVMMFIGLMTTAVATVLYLGAGLGSGPRDGLMLALNKKTSKPVGILRTGIEVTALICGWLLGGQVGIGTLMSALGLGYAIQFMFKICGIKSKEIKHRIIADDIAYLKSLKSNKNA